MPISKGITPMLMNLTHVSRRSIFTLVGVKTTLISQILLNLSFENSASRNHPLFIVG